MDKKSRLCYNMEKCLEERRWRMKGLRMVLVLLAIFAVLCQPVAAASSAQSVQTSATAAKDGKVYLTMQLQLQLEQATKISLPLPVGAQNVRLNGKLKTPTLQGQRLMLNLPELSAGVQTVQISYELDDAIVQEKGGLTLSVPLLNGFSLPIDAFSFSLTLPAALSGQPKLVSNWGEGTTAKISISNNGTVISGSGQGLLDSTELKLQCQVHAEMFPEYSSQQPLMNRWQALMVLLAVAALGYYLLALLPSIPRRMHVFGPPEGLAAGDLGTCLTGCGMDLTMMVFSWAQLGYVSILLDKRGRVRLQKRMDMGCERSEYENKVFQKLFAQGQAVDGSGLPYALLCRKVAKKSPLLRQIYRSRSGNPRIVGALAVAVGACGGVLLSQGVYTAGAGTVLLAMLLAAVCAGLSYLIQSGGRCIPLGNKQPMWLGVLCAGGWLALGALCGNGMLAALLVAYEALTGIAVAVGGRRSENGRQYLAQIRGLRAYLTRGSVFQIQQCLERNPSYFFELMPYALALGVEKRFARRFGKIRLAECDYLLTQQRDLTPIQWAFVLRQVADCLDRRQRRLKYEQMLGKIANKSVK